MLDKLLVLFSVLLCYLACCSGCYLLLFRLHLPSSHHLLHLFNFFYLFFHLNLPSTHFRFSFALSPLVKCSILITLKLQRYQLSPSAFYRYRKHSAVSEKNSAYWSSVVVQCTEKIDDDLAEIEELCHFFLFHCHSLFLLCVGSEIKYVICRTSALDRLSEKCCQCC